MSENVVTVLFGSHLYGLNDESSDTDYKGIVMPTKEQILLGAANFSTNKSTGSSNSKNSADDVDTEVFSFQKFLKLAAAGETVAIDMLHAPKSAIIEGSEYWDWLVANKDKFYTKNMKAYIGYVRKQAAKYGVKGSRLAVLEDVLMIVGAGGNDTYLEQINTTTTKGQVLTLTKTVGQILNTLPVTEFSGIVTGTTKAGDEQTFYELLGRKYQTTLKIPMFRDQLSRVWESYGARAQAAKDNKGIDWKAVSHALRAGYQAKHIYQDGGFSYPLPETAFLKDVKLGNLDYLSVVQPALENIVDEVMELADKSSYPDKVDQKWVDSIVYNVHSDILKED